jgi:hypothetical protein
LPLLFLLLPMAVVVPEPLVVPVTVVATVLAMVDIVAFYLKGQQKLEALYLS